MSVIERSGISHLPIFTPLPLQRDKTEAAATMVNVLDRDGMRKGNTSVGIR